MKPTDTIKEHDQQTTASSTVNAHRPDPASSRPKRQAGSTATLKPLYIIVFYHDDVATKAHDRIYEDSLSWITSELEKITDRQVTLGFHNDSKLTRFDYKRNNTGESISGWNTEVGYYRSESIARYGEDNFHPKRVKYLLITADNVSDEASGVAYQGGFSAIAPERAIAHEIGHLFGATHEDGEITYNGWWSESIMHEDYASGLRTERQQFSEKNRQNIRNYLSDVD